MATTALGNALRYFARVTCPEFSTFETSAEHAKRQRQQAATTQSTSAVPSSTGRQPRTFSLRTIKLHFLGDYVSCIKMFGTIDNYNSALVSEVPAPLSLSKPITFRERIVTTGLNSIPSQGATTRRQRSNLVRWITSISMSAESQTTSGGPVSPFPVTIPHRSPPKSHNRRPSLAL